LRRDEGVSETVVRQRLKLADASSKLIAAYRKGEMTLRHVMAFTVTDDHAAQERVWSSLPEWQKGDPSIIRDCLSEHEITASDRRVKFATLKVYEKAGGAIRRDLLSDGEQGVFIDDLVLLESLVAKKLTHRGPQPSCRVRDPGRDERRERTRHHAPDRHKSSMMLAEYIRVGQMFTHNAAAGLGI
jgi:hypothetical protein